MKMANIDLSQNLKDEEVRTADASNRLGLAAANTKSHEIDYDGINHTLR